MIKKQQFFVYLLSIILLIFIVNIPLPSNNTINKNVIFVKSMIKSNSNFAKNVLKLDGDIGVNRWVISIFKTEKINTITFNSAIEKTSLVNVFFNERKFDLIINKGSEAEYFMTILIKNTGEFSLSNLSVRIS